MKILFVSDSFPYPPDSGVKVRDFNLIRHLSDRCELGLLAFIFSEREELGVAEMRKYCNPVEIVRFQRQPMWQHVPGVMKHLLTLQPLANKFVYSSEMAAKLARMTSEKHFDLVQIDCTPMAPYQVYINGRNSVDRSTRKALVFIDVNAHKFRRRLRYERSLNMRLRNFIDWLMMCRWEARYAEHFDTCVMMSELDAQRLKRRNPQLPTAVIPNGVDVDEKRPSPEQSHNHDILLIGALSHPPWADAVHYFHDQIFSRVRTKLPDARMVIVGNAPLHIQALASPQVIVTGWVESVESYYRQALLSVVPLRSGGGTRLKILESLAYGRAVVSTTVGCEGLDLVPDHDLLVANEPVQFAEQVVRLMLDGELRHRLVGNGRVTVENKYNWQTIADKLLATYEDICLAPNKGGINAA